MRAAYYAAFDIYIHITRHTIVLMLLFHANIFVIYAITLF